MTRCATAPVSVNSQIHCIKLPFLLELFKLREGTSFLGEWGRAGASEGRVISESEHQKVRAGFQMTSLKFKLQSY